MSLYKDFKTSEKLEVEGVRFENGTYSYTLARSGGANKKFQKLFERLSRPHRRQLDNGTLDNVVAERLMREVFAKTVIIRWETFQNDGWVEGIELEDGTIVPATPDTLVKVFEDLPDLFTQITEDAKSTAYFRQAGLEEDSGN
jgi:hypothetical protein